MNTSAKDLVGILLAIGTSVVLVLHNTSFGHQATHTGTVADAGGSVTTAVGERPTAFVGFNVLPMTGDLVRRDQVVIVRGGAIERIGRVGLVEPPRNAYRIEGDGTQYIVPGLTDAHVHLRGGYESWLPLFVANGVTTVFNLEGNPGHLALRERIRTGQQAGPTVYTAGPYVNESTVRTAADARRQARRQADLGYDFLKVRGRLSSEAYRELIAAGDEFGLPVIGHAPPNLPFSEVIEHGQVGITHAEELIQTRLRTLDTAELGVVASTMAAAGTWLTPTLAYFKGTADQWASMAGVESALATPAASHLPAAVRTAWREQNVLLDMDPGAREGIQEMYDFHLPLIRALHAAGVPLLAGTDAPLPGSAPGFSVHAEIQALREAGLTGYAALAAATSNPGRFVRAEVEAGSPFGTVEPRARADLLVVDGDPRDDPTVLSRPSKVMVRGRLYERADLDRMLSEVAGR